MNIFKGQNLLEFYCTLPNGLRLQEIPLRNQMEKRLQMCPMWTQSLSGTQGFFHARATSVVIPSQLQPIPCSTR